MSDAKWTPGPWKAHFAEAYVVTGPDRGRVAMMMNLKGPHGMGGRRSGDEAAANARLIAAAPDLYKALQDCLDVLEHGLCSPAEARPEIRQAIEALAYARGKS